LRARYGYYGGYDDEREDYGDSDADDEDPYAH
jgi:hypothetical protein